MKAMEYHCVGLKCDAEGCGYVDDTVSLEDYNKWLNVPCPKCGANLLTEADHAAVKAMLGVVGWVNAMLPGDHQEQPAEKIRVEMDGSGIPSFKVVPTGDSDAAQ